MFKTSARVLVAVMVASLPLAAAAQSAGEVLLPSQMVITGTLESPLSSKTTQVGDPFILDVTTPYPQDDPRFGGARVDGHVADVQHAAASKKGGIELAFDRIRLNDGTTASLQGEVLSLDAQGNRANSTVKTIAGAVVGDLLGNFLGKMIGTNIGGALGAVAGGIYAASTGQNITVAAGSTVSLKTTAPATVLSRRRQMQQILPAGPELPPAPVDDNERGNARGAR